MYVVSDGGGAPFFYSAGVDALVGVPVAAAVRDEYLYGVSGLDGSRFGLLSGHMGGLYL